MADPYRIELADVERDRPRILEFWKRANFSAPDRAERYDWFHRGNPAGRSRIYLLLYGDQGELVGTACAGTRLISSAEGRLLTASVLIDFAVDPAHRSVGPALKLQRALRESELLQADVLYGLPDTKAVPIFKRLGSDALLNEGSYASVVRSRKYVEQRVPGWAAPVAQLAAAVIDRLRALVLRVGVAASGYSCAWTSTPPVGLDELWARSRRRDCGIGVRDRNYLAWRFGLPGWRFASIRSRGRAELMAYMACRTVADEWHVGDLLLPEDEAAASRALRALLAEAWGAGVRVVRLDLIADRSALRALHAAGFVLRGERPCFIVRNPALPTAAFPARWWFTRADEDV